jgi:hypothetical protein
VLNNFHGVGTGSVFISNLLCQGTESNITECTYEKSILINRCSDASVVCAGKIILLPAHNTGTRDVCIL